MKRGMYFYSIQGSELAVQPRQPPRLSNPTWMKHPRWLKKPFPFIRCVENINPTPLGRKTGILPLGLLMPPTVQGTQPPSETEALMKLRATFHISLVD